MGNNNNLFYICFHPLALCVILPTNMITSITMRDFLSYENATIPLGPLTCIIGPNLSGKTSILRAFRWCLLNEGSWNDDPYKDSVRRQLDNGELAPSTSVTVEFDDGLAITRERGPGSRNAYIIRKQDGTTLEIGGQGSSVGRGYCPDIAELTGIKQITWPDDTSFYPQFSNDASEGRFLINDGPTSIDTKLGVILGLNTIEAATKLAATKANSGNRQLKEAENQVTQLEASLSEFDGLDAVLKLDEECTRLGLASTKAEEHRRWTEGWVTKLQELNQAVSQEPNVKCALGEASEVKALLQNAERATRKAEEFGEKHDAFIRLHNRAGSNGCTISILAPMVEWAKRAAHISNLLHQLASLPQPTNKPKQLQDSLPGVRAQIATASAQKAAATQVGILAAKLRTNAHSLMLTEGLVKMHEQELARERASITVCPINSEWTKHCPHLGVL